MKLKPAVMFCVIAAALLTACSPDSNTTPQIEVGSLVYLYQRTDTAFVGVDEESLNALGEALAAKDETGFRYLILSGRVLTMPASTKVLVLKSGLSLKVRVLEGRYVEQIVWTDSAGVTKRLPTAN